MVILCVSVGNVLVFSLRIYFLRNYLKRLVNKESACFIFDLFHSCNLRKCQCLTNIKKVKI